ncbi:MAG TPA: radical SAM protein, partial [Nitrospirae bacterium]|nr:radical SAM protein [Nitrospirota bacterium]
IRNMAEAGCVQIDFGVERGSDEALRLLKKGITIRKIKDVFRLCDKYKIRTFANFLVNLPEEKEEDLDDIIDLMNELNPEIVSLNIFTPYPGTEIYSNASYKFTKEEYPMLAYATTLINTHPDKLKFAEHNTDLIEWTHKYHRQYNKTLNNVKFYLTKKYWTTLFKSKYKINYLKNSVLLIKEFINQKI